LFCFKLFAFLLEFVSGEEELFPDRRRLVGGGWCCCAPCLDCFCPAASIEVKGRGGRKDGDWLGRGRAAEVLEEAEVDMLYGLGSPRAAGEGRGREGDGVKEAEEKEEEEDEKDEEEEEEEEEDKEVEDNGAGASDGTKAAGEYDDAKDNVPLVFFDCTNRLYLEIGYLPRLCEELLNTTTIGPFDRKFSMCLIQICCATTTSFSVISGGRSVTKKTRICSESVTLYSLV
jgi:hypothetical protein